MPTITIAPDPNAPGKFEAQHTICWDPQKPKAEAQAANQAMCLALDALSKHPACSRITLVNPCDLLAALANKPT